MRVLVTVRIVPSRLAPVRVGVQMGDAVMVSVKVEMNAVARQANQYMPAKENQHDADGGFQAMRQGLRQGAPSITAPPPNTNNVRVCPIPQTTPCLTIRRTDLSSDEMLAAATWSASSAWCMPIKNPRNRIDAINPPHF